MSAKRIAENLRDANEVGIRLLMTDAEVALTLLDAANIRSDAAGRSRKVQEARKAYDSILHLLPHYTLDETQSQELDERMTQLRKTADSGGRSAGVAGVDDLGEFRETYQRLIAMERIWPAAVLSSATGA